MDKIVYVYKDFVLKMLTDKDSKPIASQISELVKLLIGLNSVRKIILNTKGIRKMLILNL